MEQKPTDDFAQATLAGVSLAGQALMWLLSLPWLIIGAGLWFSDHSSVHGVVTASVCFGAGLALCPPIVKKVIAAEVRQGRPPQPAALFVGIYLALAFIGIVLAVHGEHPTVQPAAAVKSGAHEPLGTDVDLSQAQPYRQIVRLNAFPSPPGKGRFRIKIAAPTATTYQQRAQTVMRAALDLVKGNTYEVSVWLMAGHNGSDLAAAADYNPYGELAWGGSAPVWDVSAEKNDGSGYLNPYKVTLLHSGSSSHSR